MASYLQELMDQTISVITNDGRNIIVSAYFGLVMLASVGVQHLSGVLKGYDQCINVVLTESFERVYSLDEPVAVKTLGLHIIRGDNIAVIGEVPEGIREEVINDQTRADPLKPLVH